jgi:hypothetical protein
MSQTSLATKPGLINNFANSPLIFRKRNAPGSATYESVSDAATADSLEIVGFGRFELGSVRYFRAVKPVNGTKHKITIDATDANQFAVQANLPAGAIIVFKLEIKSTDSRGEFASEDTRETRYQPPFEYVCRGNDTAAQVLAGLAKQLTLAKSLFPEADGAGEPYVASFDAASSVLTLEAADVHLILKLYVDDLFYDNAAQVPVFAPVTVSEQFEGRGTYVQLHNIIHETEGSNELYAHSRREGLPARSALYTQLGFGTGTDRPDLSGPSAASSSVFQKPDFYLYVSETASNDGQLDAVLTFFNRSTGVKEFIKGDVPGTPGVLADLTGAAIPVANPALEDPENN